MVSFFLGADGDLFSLLTTANDVISYIECININALDTLVNEPCPMFKLQNPFNGSL